MRAWWGIGAMAVVLAGCRGTAEPAAHPGAANVEPVLQPLDADETAAIAAATTDARYLTPLVRDLPDHPDVPSPRDALGYTIGTPQRCTPAAAIHAYYRRLAETSDRVQVVDHGTTQEGRASLTVAIADPALLATLEANVARLVQLGDGRRPLDAAACDALLRQTVPIYWITAGLHSTELGPPECVTELAYRLAVSEAPHIQAIRRGVITLITPVLEVDGRERQVEWYRRHVQGYANHDDMPPRSPPYWGHYTFHDNNRDAIMLTQPATRNYLATYRRFRPTVSLDLHESVPLLYVSMGTGPYNPVIDPITQSEWQWMSAHEVSRLTGMGLPGVWTWGYYTGWAPSYLLWVTNLRNSCGRFYETFGNGTADTQARRLTEAEFAGVKVTERAWYRSAPAPKTLTWSMRDNVNYMESAVLTSLQFVATHAEEFLRNHRRKAEDAIRRGRSEKPHAFGIPADQRDPGALRDLLDVLLRQGLEVHQLDADFVPAATIPERDTGAARAKRTLPAGTYVVRCDQPWRPLVNVLLGVQEFPKDAEHPPYDDVGWTLGLMMGVEVQPVADAAVLDAAMQRIATTPALPDRVTRADPQGPAWLVPQRPGIRSLAPFCYALGPGSITALDQDGEIQGVTMPAGSLVIAQASAERVEAAARRFGIEAHRVGGNWGVVTHTVDLPRIAVLTTWNHTQDTGWLRYALDHFDIPYTLIAKERVRGGDLRRDFDVLLVADNGGFTGWIHGIARKWGPLAYTTTDAFPSHGRILSSPDITGGIGWDGMAAIQAFVQGGGTLVTLGNGARLVTESGLARGVSMAGGGGPLPGSVVTARVRRRDHPLTYGYDDVCHLFRANVAPFGVRRYDERFVVLQWGTKPPYPPDDPDATDEGTGTGDGKQKRQKLVLSGGYQGFERIDGKPAVLDVPVGQGHVVLIGPAVTRRFQDHVDFPLLWNALLHWNDFPAPDPPDETRR